MSKLVRFIIVLVFVLVLGGALVRWLAQPLLRRAVPELNRMISSALGHDVALGKIDFSFLPGPGLEVSQLTVGADRKNQISLASLKLSTGFGALLGQQISVSDLSLTGARIPAARRQDGSLSIGPLIFGGPKKEKLVDTSAPAPSAGPAPAATPAPAAEPPSVPPAPPADATPVPAPTLAPGEVEPLALAIKHVEVSDAVITLLDEKAAPAQRLQLALSNVQAVYADASDQVKADAAGELSGALNGKLTATAEIQRATRRGELPPFSLSAELSGLGLERVKPLLSAYGISANDMQLAGELTAAVKLAAAANSTFDASAAIDGAKSALNIPLFFNKASGVPLSLNLSANYAPGGSLNAQRLALVLGPHEIQAPFSFAPQSGSFRAALTIPGLDLGTLRDHLIPLAMLRAEGRLEGKVDCSLQTAEPPNLNGALQLSEVALTAPLSGAAVPITSLEAKINFAGQTVKAAPAAFRIFKGTAAATAEITPERILALSLTANSLSLADISATFLRDSTLKLNDTVSSSTITARAAVNDIKNSLNAAFRAAGENGAIQGVNVLGEAFRRAGELPLLNQGLSSLIPAKYQPLFAASDTAFDRLSLSGSIKAGDIALEELALQHSLYQITGSGTIAPTGAFNIRAQLKLGSAFVQEMTQHQPKTALLVNDQGQIEIPLLIKKEAGGSTLVLPDLQAAGKRMATNKAKDAAKKAAERISPNLGSTLESLFK